MIKLLATHYIFHIRHLGSSYVIFIAPDTLYLLTLEMRNPGRCVGGRASEHNEVVENQVWNAASQNIWI